MFLIKLMILLSGGFNAAYSMDKNARLEQIPQRQEGAGQRSQQQIQQQKQELENFILGPITEQELKTTNAFQNSNLSQLEIKLRNRNEQEVLINSFKEKSNNSVLTLHEQMNLRRLQAIVQQNRADNSDEDNSDEEDNGPTPEQQTQQLTTQITQTKNALMADLGVIAEIRKKRLRLKIDHPYFKGDEFKNNINPNATDRLTIMALTALFSFDQNLLGDFLQNLGNNDRNTIFGTNDVQNIMVAYHHVSEETLENSTAYLHQLPNNIKQALFNNFPNFMNSLNTVLQNTIFSPESVNLVNNNTAQQNDTENFGRTVEDKAKRFSAGGDALVLLINAYHNEKIKIAYATSLIL